MIPMSLKTAMYLWLVLPELTPDHLIELAERKVTPDA